MVPICRVKRRPDGYVKLQRCVRRALAKNTILRTMVAQSLNILGSALYVFLIIPPADGTETGGVHLNFMLDSEPAGTFDTLGAPGGFQYNFPVYTNATIPNGPHTFVLQNGGRTDNNSLALLDYMVYT